MDNKIIESKIEAGIYPKWMTEHILNYAKKIIAKPIKEVEKINPYSISSVKQRLKK